MLGIEVAQKIFRAIGASVFFFIFTPEKIGFPRFKTLVMSDIQNVGRKGYCMLYFFIFMLLFVILVVAIYKYNGKFLPLS